MDDSKKDDKSFFDYIKAGFKPMGARAQDAVDENRAKYGDKLRIDMQKSREERAKGIKKGFFGE